MSPNSSPDWFARSIAVLAIFGTVISLYFAYRNYQWQTRESLEENIFLRAGFRYSLDKNNHRGQLKIDLTNLGLHPIFVESVRIEVPCEPNTPQTLGDCQQCTLEGCDVPVYERDPTQLLKPLKAIEPGDVATYTKESWDFSKYPLQEWVQAGQFEDKVWIDVATTRKRFRQHALLYWTQVTATVPRTQ